MTACCLPVEVEQIFSRYQTEQEKQLNKAQALSLMQVEFGLTEPQSEQMFATFDEDHDEIMSILEFEQFYKIVGNAAGEIVQKFRDMDVDDSGMLDLDEAKTGLSGLVLEDGRTLSEDEIEYFLKAAVNEEDLIDISNFANMLYQLKMYKPK